MRKISKYLLITFFAVFLHENAAAQNSEKPKILVNFEISPGTLFHRQFVNEIDSIQSKGLDILMGGLSDHLRHLDFEKNLNSNPDIQILDIKLDKKKGTSGSTEMIQLQFDMQGVNDTIVTSDFFNTTERLAFNSSSDMLESLQRKLDVYLEGHANNDLVKKFFQKIPFVLPDRQYFFIGTNMKAAILPFSKNDLSIDYENSRFTVKWFYDESGAPAPKYHDNLRGTIERKFNISSLNEITCIMIELNSTPVTDFLNGEVYIVDYSMKIYTSNSDNSSPNDFTNSIPEE